MDKLDTCFLGVILGFIIGCILIFTLASNDLEARNKEITSENDFYLENAFYKCLKVFEPVIRVKARFFNETPISENMVISE